MQFLATLNDQAFMQALMIALAYRTASFTRLDADTAPNLVLALFVLPALGLSSIAGQLADKYEKSLLIRAALLLQLGCMALAAAGFALRSVPALLGAVLLGGAQATLLAPVKFSMLPQRLGSAELVGGNGLMVAGTALAVMTGMLYGGALAAQPGGLVLLAASTIGLCGLALVVARAIPPAPAPVPGLSVDWHPWRSTRHLLLLAGRDRMVLAAIAGMAWFWFHAVLLATQMPNLARRVLQASEYGATLLLVAWALGMGIGALLCDRMSGRKVEAGLVPFGAIGVTLSGLDIAWTAASGGAGWRIAADLALLGVFGGLYTVPLCALVQERSAAEYRARIIAASTFLNAAFAALAAAFAIALFQAGATIAQAFLAAALLNVAATLAICRAVPEIPARFLAWLLVRSAYRLEVSGIERIPPGGAALLVCNHVSYVDVIVVTAACPRPIRWVIDHRIYRLPVLRVLFRMLRAIPIARARDDPAMLARAYDAIGAALAGGEVVGLFPEGRLTRDGELGEFRPGVRRVLDRTPVTVVPMALSGLWQSAFARRRGRLRRALAPFPRVRLSVGNAMEPHAVTPQALRAAVLALRGGWR